MRYEVFAGDVAIGWSELETGDPPMGVASGVLHPSDAYGRTVVGAELRVRPEGGAFFKAVGGVHIEDHSRELGAGAIEVSVLGLDADTYERYFAMHVRAYEKQFSE